MNDATQDAPAGWVTVPNTATHNMLNAANAGRKKGRSSSGEIYAAMISAAPEAPAVRQAVTELRRALFTIAMLPLPEQDNMVAANMRKIAEDALQAELTPPALRADTPEVGNEG